MRVSLDTIIVMLDNWNSQSKSYKIFKKHYPKIKRAWSSPFRKNTLRKNTFGTMVLKIDSSLQLTENTEWGS